MFFDLFLIFDFLFLGQPDPSQPDFSETPHAYSGRKFRVLNAEGVETVRLAALRRDGGDGSVEIAGVWSSLEQGASTVDILWYSPGKALYDVVERTAVHGNAQKLRVGRVRLSRSPVENSHVYLK